MLLYFYLINKNDICTSERNADVLIHTYKEIALAVRNTKHIEVGLYRDMMANQHMMVHTFLGKSEKF